MQRMRNGSFERVKGITHSHMSLNSEEYDVKNDDNKRKKEKGSFQSSLFNSRIYLLQERQEEWVHFEGSTFHSFLSFTQFRVHHSPEKNEEKASKRNVPPINIIKINYLIISQIQVCQLI